MYLVLSHYIYGYAATMTISSDFFFFVEIWHVMTEDLKIEASLVESRFREINT